VKQHPFKFAGEYLQLPEQNLSAVVASQPWGEVHRVSARMPQALSRHPRVLFFPSRINNDQ